MGSKYYKVGIDPHSSFASTHFTLTVLKTSKILSWRNQFYLVISLHHYRVRWDEHAHWWSAFWLNCVTNLILAYPHWAQNLSLHLTPRISRTLSPMITLTSQVNKAVIIATWMTISVCMLAMTWTMQVTFKCLPSILRLPARKSGKPPRRKQSSFEILWTALTRWRHRRENTRRVGWYCSKTMGREAVYR